MTEQIEYRKVRYVGTHPWIKNKIGISCFSEQMGRWMFLPYFSEERDDWYLVFPQNLVEVNDEDED